VADSDSRRTRCRRRTRRWHLDRRTCCLDHDVVRGADDDAAWPVLPVCQPLFAEYVVPHASLITCGPAAGHLPLDGVVSVVLEEVFVDIPGAVLAVVAPDPVPRLVVDVGVRQREIAGTLRVCGGDLHASGIGLSLSHRPWTAVVPAVHVDHGEATGTCDAVPAVVVAIDGSNVSRSELLTIALPHEAGEIVPFLLQQSAERSDGVRTPEIPSSANVVRP